ncbi:unnamed protein product, partial [Brassica oleracea var. botrytis]
ICPCLSLRRCFPRKSFLSSSSNPNHSIFSVASDLDLLLAVASAKSIVLELHSRVCSHRTSLKTLKLLDCYKVGDESVSSMARICKNLETLIIGGCRDISDESIILLADSCRDGLKNLRMDWQVTCQSSVDCRECTNLLVDSAHCHLGGLSFE